MELITNIIIEYLKHNKRIVVPKLGAFIVKQPSGIIRFSDLMRNDDGVLRSLLMAYGVKELEANGMIDRFVFEIRHAIGREESFTVENLGVFAPGDNNTISFTHKHEPIVIGGNIKPPVDILNQLQRAENTIPQPNKQNNGKAIAHNKKKKGRNEPEDDSTLSLGKPDDYLRGLKYDKDKNKKRNEERNDSLRKSSGPSLIWIVIIALIAGGIIWGGWQWLNRQSITQTIIEPEIEAPEFVEPLMIEPDRIIEVEPTDSLITDDTAAKTLVLDSENVVITDNSVTE